MRIVLSPLVISLVLCLSPPVHAEKNNISCFPGIQLLLSAGSGGPAPASCAGAPPAEGPITDAYRSYAYAPPDSVVAIDISLRGWRTIAGTEGSGFYLFSRSQGEPIVHGLVDSSIIDVDLNRDGSVAAVSDENGRIYLFECDAAQPSWTYLTAPDDDEIYPEVELSLSDDGRWLAAASDYHLYLFRRDSSTPVLNIELSQNQRLSTLAFSGDGSRLAVATEFGQGVNNQRSATIFFLDRKGLRWQSVVNADDSECTSNISFLPIALSRDGKKLAAGGCDDQLRFWDTSNSTPSWTAEVGSGEMITGLAMAADGKNLAFTNETIRYVRDTSTQPDFSSPANWAFNYWLTYQQPSVYGALDNWGSWVGEGLTGKPPIEGVENISMSDNGHYIFAGATGLSYLLHRDDNEVTRLFGTLQGDVGQYFEAAAISPEASWVATGSIYGNEILRFEVAPVQKIKTNLPLSVTFPGDPTGITDFFDHFGVDSYTISYTVLKPGRAVDVQQYWSLWGFDGVVFVSPFSDLLCSGDSEWSWTLNLPDGDVESIGTREIEPPQCMASNVSGISAFDLFADLKPVHSGQGGVSNFYTDSVPLLKIQVGSGP